MKKDSRCLFLALLLAAPAVGAEHFLTMPLPAHVQGAVVRFDFSALPPAARIVRGILRVPTRGHRTGVAVRLVPVGLPDARPLAPRPPDYTSFDATAWAADPRAGQGLRIAESAGLDFRKATLEASILGTAKAPIPPVTELKAIQQSGQTFVTWREIEDVVGDDAPTFDAFDKAVLEARAKRRAVYRVYRHTKPIAAGNLGDAELAREVPEVVSCWNLKAIRNTEHPNQGTPTKRSVLRPGYNLARNYIMTRYRITPGGEPLPRATGLAAFTVTKPGRRYYAVAASIGGREAIARIASLAEPVDERPATFPAIVYQRTNDGDPQRHKCAVDVYNAWIEPPYHNVPAVSETFVVRWRDVQGSAEMRLPLMLTTGTHGGSATELANPGWHGARRHVKGARSIGVTEGGLWQGFHECIGTLRGYGDGVVHNYPQRRVLAAAAWAVANEGLFVDPERVSIWGQMAHWGLRHGDRFAAVMSNGYGNLAIGKEAQKHGWKWGPYPKGCKNWLGVDQWEYMNLAKWIRENPTVELPYWLCWPAYGAYPSHTIGDFGFMPWPEVIHAMASTKRAFAANWSTNGPGPLGPLRDLVPRIRRRQSLPAFTRCSLDASPGDGDHADAEKGGGINLYQLWEPETIVDQPDRWAITIVLRKDCPRDACTTDVTPRRCQRFRAEPGQSFAWASSTPDGERQLQSGTATADRHGLVTVASLAIARTPRRLTIRRR